jgi:VWFA-related protein
MSRRRTASSLASLTCGIAAALSFASTAQAQAPGEPTLVDAATPTLTSQSTLVLVPALVRNKADELVFTLKADDFVLTDDGIPQKLRLEQDTGGEPLALAVVIEGGGAGVRELGKYGAIAPMLESVIGGVPHRVAVVGFDSSPVLVQDFTPDVDSAAHAVKALIEDNNGDNGAAILDSLGFAVDLLRKQPPEYRRAILLISETLDRSSHLKLEEALRATSDTNTAIYSIGFSSGRDYVKTEAPKTLGKGVIPGVSSQDPAAPGPAHGCMSRDPNDPQVDLSKSVAAQAFDCLSLLAPPLRLAKMAVIAAMDGFQKNIPETVARLTGGEYYKLTNAKSLERDLATISNHLPNRYVLSFQPQTPHSGLHAISLHLPRYPQLEVTARSSYWADAAPTP